MTPSKSKPLSKDSDIKATPVKTRSQSSVSKGKTVRKPSASVAATMPVKSQGRPKTIKSTPVKTSANSVKKENELYKEF